VLRWAKNAADVACLYWLGGGFKQRLHLPVQRPAGALCAAR